MPIVSTKRPKASAVKQSSIQDTNAFLQALPEKPKEDLSLREAVEQMRDSVRAALAKGYTYQELAAMLTEKGIKISAFTLKNYVPSGRRRSTKEQPVEALPKRTRKPKASPFSTSALSPLAVMESSPEPSNLDRDEDDEDDEDVADTPELEVTPTETKPRGRGRATTAAKAKSESEATVKQPTVRRRRSSTLQSGGTTTKGRKKAGA